MKDNPSAPVQERVLDSGYFDAPTLSDLLGAIFRRRWTGTLQLARDGSATRIQCWDGIPREVLGTASASLSVAATLDEIFQWTGGSFRLTEGPRPQSPPKGSPPDVCALIYRGSAHFSPEQLRGLAFRLDGVVLPASSVERATEDVSLHPTGQRILAALDGHRTVGEVLRSVPLAESMGIRVLYALHATQQGQATVSSVRDLRRPPSGSSRRSPTSASEVTQVVASASLGPAEAARLLAAEGKFHRAKKLIAKKDYETAHARLLEATQLDGQEGDYRAYLGWTRFQVSPQDPMVVERALEDLGQALALNPRSDKAYLFRGNIHEARGDLKEAQADYERALHCNADSHDALRALRRMNASVT